MSYHEDFQRFNGFARQIEASFESIKAVDLPFHDNFVFVDAGSNNGDLTSKIRQFLLDSREHVRTHAFEPDKKACLELDVLFKRNEDVIVENVNWTDWYEIHGTRLAGTVDLLLNSHTFYHYEPSVWVDLFENGNSLLSQDGKHVVIVVSAETSYLGFRNQLVDETGLDKGLRGRGNHVVGKTIQDALDDYGYSYEVSSSYVPLIIPSNNQAVNNFSRVLGFSFRYKPNDVLSYLEGELIDFLGERRVGINFVIPRFQDTIILGKK